MVINNGDSSINRGVVCFNLLLIFFSSWAHELAGICGGQFSIILRVNVRSQRSQNM